MKRLQSSVWFVFKALLLVTMLAMVSAGPAEAKKSDRCSAEGQKPCPIHYKGPICDAGLGKFGKTCQKCGKNGQRACPTSAKGKRCAGKLMRIDGRCYSKCGGPGEKACAKVKRGYPCRGNYEPDNRGFCKPCGGPNQTVCRALKAGKQCHSGTAKFGAKCERCGGLNQKACPVLKAGKQCNGGLTKIKGTCQRCGDRNQQACPKLAGGYPCKGKLEPNSRNICTPCGGVNQTACRALKAGKQCDPGLTKIGGVCQSCGGRNERACPKLAGGYPCKGKLEPNQSNICIPCGGKGQKACRAFKAGKRCDPPLKNISGICTACGGPDERACPKLATGYPCRGKFAPNSAGICKPCGGTGQKACRVLKAGRQCAEGSTERGGVCVTCGGEGQRACKITDKGKACADGMKRGLNGICKITPAGETKRRALAELKNLGKDVLPVLGFSANIGGSESVQRSLNNAGSGDAPPDANVDTREVCLGNKYGAVTVGVGGEAGFIINFEGETGVAIRCGAHAKNQKDTKWYNSGSINWRAGGGVSSGVTVGLWKDDFNKLRGKSHGYVLDIIDAVESGMALKKRDISKKLVKYKGGGLKGFVKDNAALEVALGVWFERLDEDGDGKDNEVGRFLGFTITVAGAVGMDVGGAYVRAKTTQKCDLDMKCTEGFWAGGGKVIHITEQTEEAFSASIDDAAPVDIGKRSYRKYKDDSVGEFKFRKNFKLLKFTPQGGSELKLRLVTPPSAEGIWSGKVGDNDTAIVIDKQFKERTKVSGGRDTVEEYLFAAVDGGDRERFDRKRGRTWEDADGDKIKFRKNWTVLHYNPTGPGKGDLARSDIAPLPQSSDSIDALGLWDFFVNGRTLTEEIVAQDGTGITVRRLDTELDRTYDKIGDNIYQSSSGGKIRVVTDTRALWISPDGKTIFQLNRR